MNTHIADIVELIETGTKTPEELTSDERSALNLYYVACSRSRKQLIGASYL